MIESLVTICFEYKKFDLESYDLIWIWFYFMWFDLNKSQVEVIWAKEYDDFVGIFTAVQLNC